MAQNKKVVTAEQVTAANREFHNEIADEYDKRFELNHPAVHEYFHKFFRDQIFSHIAADKELSVLDVGCGTGYLEQYLVGRKVSVDGIDVSERMLELARRQYPLETFSQFRFRQQDVYRLSEEPQQYDLVLGNSFLHHCQDYERVLETLAQKVKPEGVMFFGMEPNRFVYRYLFFVVSLSRRLIYGKKSHDHEGLKPGEELVEYHFHYSPGFSPRQIRKKLKKLGFSKVKFFYTGRHTLARILDDTGVNFFPFIPIWLLDHLGYFSPLFHIVAYKD